MHLLLNFFCYFAHLLSILLYSQGLLGRMLPFVWRKWSHYFSFTPSFFALFQGIWGPRDSKMKWQSNLLPVPSPNLWVRSVWVVAQRISVVLPSIVLANLSSHSPHVWRDFSKNLHKLSCYSGCSNGKSQATSEDGFPMGWIPVGGVDLQGFSAGISQRVDRMWRKDWIRFNFYLYIVSTHEKDGMEDFLHLLVTLKSHSSRTEFPQRWGLYGNIQSAWSQYLLEQYWTAWNYVWLSATSF